MALTYKPETTQKKIAEFKEFLDEFTDILYNKNYVPDNIYGRDKLYRVFREVKDWLKWQKTEKESERIFQGIKNVIERDSEGYGFPDHLDNSTFRELLHLGEVTEKLIDGTYHLAPDFEPDGRTMLSIKEGGNEYARIIIQDENNERVGNYAWLQLLDEEYLAQFDCSDDEIPHDDDD